jgi:glycosyltransferase involved in cell wall biosynthesis
LHILACIPAYNEESQLEKLIQKTSKYVDSIVVYDDGSTDNTSIIAKKAGAYVIQHEKNLGKGAALKSLFEYSKHYNTDIIVTIDGDGQFLPEEIPKLTKLIQDNQADVVIGYRFDDEKDMPSYRKIGNKVLDKVSSMASELPFRDTQSGFRAYSKKAIDSIQFTSEGFASDSEILIDAAKKGLRISEEKISVIYNTGSKTSTKNPILHGTSVLAILIEMVLIKHPLKYLGMPGMILLISGTLTSSYVVSIFNETRYFSIPYTLGAMGLFSIGIMLILVAGILYAVNKSTSKNVTF